MRQFSTIKGSFSIKKIICQSVYRCNDYTQVRMSAHKRKICDKEVIIASLAMGKGWKYGSWLSSV